MKEKAIVIHDVESREEYRFSYEDVTSCPVCNHALFPQTQYGISVKWDDCQKPYDSYSPFYAYILSFCPQCRNAFLSKYESASNGGSTKIARKLVGLYPQSERTTMFSEALSKVSPLFVTTYHQSEIAEQQSLLEIAGCGYRKSLEYLLKDYLCKKFPKESDAIKAEFLGNSIKRVADTRIHTLAERAVWIGNDETHYVKKHEDLDINDMKRFIYALVHYIDYELTFEDALSVPYIK